jgi:hypothetical protein
MKQVQGYKTDVIVVLGAGRCGTSLLMQVLAECGMSVSKRLVQPRAHNVAGPMEDINLSEIYNEFLKQIGSNRLFPVQIDGIKDELLIETQRKLRSLLKANLKASTSTWGFKDPFTANLLPIWFRIFNKEGVIPKFVLTVRNPSHSVISRKKHFGASYSIGELAWLSNYTEAIINTSADFFVVHYEDWFRGPETLLEDLIRYCNLTSKDTESQIKNIINNVIKKDLNRSQFDEYSVENPLALKLYDELMRCNGPEFNRNRLITVARECQKSMAHYKGWYEYANILQSREIELIEKINTSSDLTEKCESLAVLVKEKESQLAENDTVINDLKRSSKESVAKYDMAIKGMKSDLKTLIDENKKVQTENILLKENSTIYQKKIAALLQSDGLSKKHRKRSFKSDEYRSIRWHREYLLIKHSYSFRLGKIFIDGIKTPGINTVKIPILISLLVWDSITGNGKKKLEDALSGII